MTLCKPWMTHKSQKAYFLWVPFKKINKFNINKTNTKKIQLKLLPVEILHIMTNNNAQV